jgi:dTDP-4-amino-4,6-dideoxygalactose transaminase
LGATACWHLFVVRHPDRERFIQTLQNNGIQTAIHYPIPPHQQPAYSEWNNMSYPITEIIHEQILSLPISPVHTKEQVLYVAEVINQHIQCV